MYDKSVEEKNSLENRIKSAVNVSGAFDNCFFHNYALYLLSNHLPLPQDLFYFTSVLADDSKAKRLQHLFPNKESLELLSLLDVKAGNPVSPNYFVEKTLILGILLREWFVTQLAGNDEHKNNMVNGEEGVCALFKNYQEVRSFLSLPELYSTEFGLLYESNQQFLEYFCNRGELLDASAPFEHYFTHSASDIDAIKAYWFEEGYDLYCKKMAQLYVKLSYVDIMIMMEIINQPLRLWSSSTGTIVAEYQGTAHFFPDFELLIDVEHNHYLLLKTEKTRNDLEEYERSYTLYAEERRIIEEVPDYPASSLLVRAICSKGRLDPEPFDALMLRLADLEPKLNEHRETDHVAPSSHSFFSPETKSIIDAYIKQNKPRDRYQLADLFDTFLTPPTPIFHRFFGACDMARDQNKSNDVIDLRGEKLSDTSTLN